MAKHILPDTVLPAIITLRYLHPNSPSVLVEFVINCFYDSLSNLNFGKISSVLLTSMIVVEGKEERHLFESLHLNRTSLSIIDQLKEVILNPVKERILGRMLILFFIIKI